MLGTPDAGVLAWREASGIEQLVREPERVGLNLKRFDELWEWSICGADAAGHPVAWDA